MLKRIENDEITNLRQLEKRLIETEIKLKNNFKLLSEVAEGKRKVANPGSFAEDPRILKSTKVDLKLAELAIKCLPLLKMHLEVKESYSTAEFARA